MCTCSNCENVADSAAEVEVYNNVSASDDSDIEEWNCYIFYLLCTYYINNFWYVDILHVFN